MRRRKVRSVVAAALICGLLLPYGLRAHAQSGYPTQGLKDHWSFDSLVSDQGDRTTATLQGDGVQLTDSGNPVFGQVLRFGAGVDNFMKLEDYINTGAGATSFSMWYRYDTTITGDDSAASTVMLQHEGSGRSVLTLRGDGKYHTYVNGTDVVSQRTVVKGGWEHITITIDQNSRQVKFYINGELDSQQALTDNAIDQVLTLRLGAHKTAGNKNPHPMRGDVDEFYVYNRVLTDEEAWAVYADKGTQLCRQQLQELVTQGQTLYDSGSLNQDDAVAVALKQALDGADLTADLAQMKAACAALEEAIANYRAAMPLKLTVNLDDIQREIDADSIFGINHRYSYNGYGTFDSETMKMNEEFAALYQQAGFGSIRYPGGTISNLFNWRTTLGDKESRKNQIHGLYNSGNQTGIAPNFGLGEAADFADEMGSELIYVYSLGRGSAQDAADLVEYMNAEVGTNPNGGIAWADVRAANGHVEPYNVRYFEIGNEMHLGPDAQRDDGVYSQGYWTLYVDGGRENAYINGGVANINKRYTVDEEDWNKVASRSDGSANLVRFLRYANLNPGIMGEDGQIVDDPDFRAVNDGVRVFVGPDDNPAEWTVVDSLANSGPEDTHCVVNYANGSIQFGDGVHGKIPPKGQNIYATYSVDRDGFVDVSQAMRDTMDEINHLSGTDQEIFVYAGYETEGFVNKMAAGGYNDLYDGVVVHPYSGTVSGSTPEEFYDNAMLKTEGSGVNPVKNFASKLPEGKVPVVSEFGIHYNTESQVRSQTHALYIAKVMMEYVNLGSPYIQKHCLSDWYQDEADSLGPTQQAVIQVVPQEGASTTTGEGEFTYFSTPSAHVFQMLNSGFGDHVVSTQMDSPKTQNNVTAVSVLASKDDQGNVYLAMVNVDRLNDYNIQLEIPGMDLAGRSVEVQYLATDGIADENTPEDPDKVHVETETVELGSVPVVNLPAHAFAVVKVPAQVVDKTQLEQTLAQARALQAEDYTADSFAGVEKAMEAAQAVLDNAQATQAEVDAAVMALTQAMEALVEAPEPSEVNKTLLEKTIAYAEGLDTTGVTDSAKAAFEKALTEAKAVMEDKNATQDQVNTAWDNLLNGIWGLGLTQGDKTMLNLVIQRAEAMMDQADKYVETNWQQLVDALAAAKNVAASGDAMQEDVDNATDALLDAILAQRFKANKDILEGLIGKAEGMDLTGYTAQSVATFRSALANAQAVMADATLSEEDQKTVDAAVAALQSAMEGLTAQGETQPSDQPETSQEPEATDKPQATQKPDRVPQTGDSAQMMVYVATLLGSVSLLAGAAYVSRKRRS